jgi:hypothetical protein
VIFVGTVAMRRRDKHLYNNKEAVFSAWSVPKSYFERNWRYSSVAFYSPDNNGVSREAEEPPLLRAVTKQRLVKTD